MPTFDPDVVPAWTVLDRVRRLHATPHRAVYVFAGAGVTALSWLHAVGGSSRTLLEATDAYHPASLRDALGHAPETAVAPEVARGLAERAQARAKRLVTDDPGPSPTFGVGLSGTIATDRTKRGAHRIEVASCDPLGTRTVSLWPRNGARTRAQEERLASEAALGVMEEACGVMHRRPLALDDEERATDRFEPSAAFREFVERRTPVLWIDPEGEPGPLPAFEPGSVPALVSGSFHPLHDGHLRLAEAAERHLGRPVAFETSARNAEKPDLDAAALRIRVRQAAGVRPVLLQHDPLFAGKAERLPGTVFVIGVDTAERVVDPRFYGGPEGLDRAFDAVRAEGASFLVAGRAGSGGYRDLSDLDLPASGADLFAPLPEFRVDLSSTEIRAAWEDREWGATATHGGSAPRETAPESEPAT